MKWLVFIFALASLLAALYFLPEKSSTQEMDPNKPWMALEPTPESSEEKEARAEDPRSVDDRMLQKDYCAASDYFRFGRHPEALASFLKKALSAGEERRDLGASSQAILAAQFAVSRDEAISKLKSQPGADAKMLLGMYQARFAGDRQDALVSLDEAEDLSPTNSMVPVYRAMVMRMQGTSLAGVATFLKEELPKRKMMESPLSRAQLDYRYLVSRDSLRFAAAGPTFQYMQDPQLKNISALLTEVASVDQQSAVLVVQAASQWQKGELEKLAPDQPDLYGQLDTVELAAELGRNAWALAYPGKPLPDMFDKRLVEELTAKHRDRNPIETKLYYGSKREESCGTKWQEAVEADYEMVRDRLRKRSVR